jgi:hypothetical protein
MGRHKLINIVEKYNRKEVMVNFFGWSTHSLILHGRTDSQHIVFFLSDETNVLCYYYL